MRAYRLTFASALKKLSALSFLTLGLLPLWSQGGRGSISGTVQDVSGASVTDATVVLTDVDKGTTLSTVTTGGGVYSFVSLSSGHYQVTVTHGGYDTAVQNNITVTVDHTSTINVKLSLAKVNETVTVDASTSLIDPSNSIVGQLIGAETIDRVPLVDRDVYQLVQLSAGVIPANGTPNSSGYGAIFNSRSLIDVSSYTINGSLQGSVYYLLDGSPIGVAENNAAAVLPAFQIPEDAVDEFRVETQNTPATYASGGGGVISLATKSGTNHFHGDAFGFFRPNALDANDYFFKLYNPGQAPPDFHRYQEGGAIGGPILHDKLFFFGDYEATQQTTLESGGFTVPTVAERNGDFSADSFTIYNPLVPDTGVVNADGSTNRTPFTSNKIPHGDLDPVALAFANKYPQPNYPADPTDPYHTGNYRSSGLDPQNAQKFDVRLDYAQSAKNRIFGRFSYGRLDFGNADLFHNGYDPYYYVNLTNTRNVLVGDDLTLGKTAVLQLRYSFTRHYENQTGAPTNNNFDIASVGFPQSLADQVVYKQMPVFNLGLTAGIGGTGNDDTFLFASENSDASATLSKTLGKHELSFGFEYQKQFMNIGQPDSPAGQYSFDNTGTSSSTYAQDGSDFADFLIGMGSGGQLTKDIIAAEANPYYASFVQDTYHLSPKLTVNAGLRWEIFGGRTERHNRQEWFDPNLAFTSNGVSLKGGERFVSSGNRSPFSTRMTDFAPRLGLGWQAAKNLVFHAGSGIYYGPSVKMVANSSLNGDGFGSYTGWNATTTLPDNNTTILNPLRNPFPAGVIQPTGSSLGAATNLGTGLSTVLRSPRTLTTYNFNFGMELELPGRTVFSLSYVGSRGLFLPFGAVDLNNLSLETIQQHGSQICPNNNPSCPQIPNFLAPVLTPNNYFYGSPTLPYYYSLMPYPQFSPGYDGGVGVNGYAGGDSEYSSLQTKLEKHMSHHVSSITSFTWGKIMSDDSQSPLGFVGSHAGAPQDWRDLRYEHAVNPQDVKFQFNSQVSWDLPIGKGRALNLNGVSKSLLGGWTLNGLVFLSDGNPIAPPVGTGDTYFNQRVDMTCDPSQNAKHTVTQWFTPACFSQPKSFLFPGTAPAYLSNVRSAGAHDLDTSIYKTFALPHEMNVRLEVAAFNTTNSVQLGGPNVFWNSNAATDPSVLAGFGQIYGDTNQPRQFQFAARYSF